MTDSLINHVVSHYRVTAQLGIGGMGVVYAGEDVRLRRPVALKFVIPGALGGPDAVARFEREARAASSLNHPNICTVYDVGEYEGQPFLVMEYLEGGTLAREIAGRPMPIDRALDVAIAVADALDAAHQRGLMHRDVKPANVFITTGRHVKLLDFGLAKSTVGRGAAAAPSAVTVAASEDDRTRDGSTHGTVAYMSPEQARGEPLDSRTDIFSFGSMLYEMTTGVRPFEAPTTALVFDALLNRQPTPPRSLNANVSPDLERIVLRALEKDPALRYQTAADLASDLRRVRRGDSGSVSAAAAKPSRPGRRVLIGSVAVLALIVIAGAAAYVMWRRGAGPDLSNVTLKQLTTSGQVGVAAVSPDGRYVAYSEEQDGRQAVLVQQVATGTSITVLASSDRQYIGLTFSRDSSYVYAVARMTWALTQVPSLGGPSRTILDGVRGPIAFSPDGTRFAFVAVDPKSFSVQVANADGSGRHALLTHGAQDLIQQSMSWSPDGRTIAAMTRAHLLMVDVATGAERPLTLKGWERLDSIAWLPSGRALLVTVEPTEEASARHQILEVAYPSGKVTRVTNDLNDYHGMTISADGRAVVAVPLSVRSKIWTTTLAAPDDARQLPGGGVSDGAQGLTWTADGRIAFADQMSVAWVVNADGSGLQPLTPTRGRARMLARCGSRPEIAFALQHADRMGIFLVDPEKGVPQQISEAASGLQPFPACTPDGRWLFYTSGRDLMKVSTAGGAPVLFGTQIHEGRVSPDGRLIAVHKVVTPGKEAFEIREVADASLVRVLPGPESNGYQWTPDGAALIGRTTSGDGIPNFERIPIDGSARSVITHFTSTDYLFVLAINPDGRVAFSRGTSDTDVVLLTAR